MLAFMANRPDTLATRVKALRKRTRGLTADDAAAAIGISRPYLSSIENGHDLPGREALAAIARYYDVSSEYLLTGGSPTPPPSPKLAKDLDELALLTFWRELDPEDRPTVLKMLGNVRRNDSAA